MAGGPLDLWNHLSMQILVLLSLGLQFVLFIFAGIRRHEASPVLRLLLWLAYIMADSTAIYAVGHLSLSGAAHDHQLVAFWAPFLLLHLGGPDNITAYALQDNQLWLRHLQTLVVQYGERTWALKCSNLDSIRSSIKKQPPARHKHFHPQDEALEEEFLVRRAHSLFHICKRAIVDSSVIEKDSDGEETTKMVHRLELWTLMEIELSLMYDILYTKAAVVHTLFGYMVRVLSPIATIAALLLFQFTGKDGHNRLDVAITYILLGGAVFMEATSLLNAVGSSWTFAFLSNTRWRWIRYVALCRGRWDRLRRAVVFLHHLVNGGRSRYKSRRWSYTMGQYNMLHLCTRRRTPTRPLLGRLAKMLGLKGWWNRKHYSGTIKMSNLVKDRISEHMQRLYTKGRLNSLGMLRKKWGQEPLDRKGFFEGILKDSLGVEFQEGIIIWHIGTDVFLAKSERAGDKDAAPHVKAIKDLSNYMMFLLVERPYMLPGLAQNKLYQRTCKNMGGMQTRSTREGYENVFAKLKNLFSLHDGPGSCSCYRASNREELANKLYDEYVNRKFSHDAPRLTYVAGLAEQLQQKETDGVDSVDLVLDVWTDILIYAGNKCSRKSHAEKVNSGGELTTILWLMAEHLYQVSLEESSITQTEDHSYDI